MALNHPERHLAVSGDTMAASRPWAIVSRGLRCWQSLAALGRESQSKEAPTEEQSGAAEFHRPCFSRRSRGEGAAEIPVRLSSPRFHEPEDHADVGDPVFGHRRW